MLREKAILRHSSKKELLRRNKPANSLILDSSLQERLEKEVSVV